MRPGRGAGRPGAPRRVRPRGVRARPAAPAAPGTVSGPCPPRPAAAAARFILPPAAGPWPPPAPGPPPMRRPPTAGAANRGVGWGRPARGRQQQGGGIRALHSPGVSTHPGPISHTSRPRAGRVAARPRGPRAPGGRSLPRPGAIRMAARRGAGAPAAVRAGDGGCARAASLAPARLRRPYPRSPAADALSSTPEPLPLPRAPRFFPARPPPPRGPAPAPPRTAPPRVSAVPKHPRQPPKADATTIAGDALSGAAAGARFSGCAMQPAPASTGSFSSLEPIDTAPNKTGYADGAVRDADGGSTL
jgi:hypothetical protein